MRRERQVGQPLGSLLPCLLGWAYLGGRIYVGGLGAMGLAGSVRTVMPVLRLRSSSGVEMAPHHASYGSDKTGPLPQQRVHANFVGERDRLTGSAGQAAGVWLRGAGQIRAASHSSLRSPSMNSRRRARSCRCSRAWNRSTMWVASGNLLLPSAVSRLASPQPGDRAASAARRPISAAFSCASAPQSPLFRPPGPLAFLSDNAGKVWHRQPMAESGERRACTGRDECLRAADRRDHD